MIQGFGQLEVFRRKENLALTPLGREKLENANIDGIRAKIMWHLKERGESSPSEIYQATGTPVQRVKGVAKELVKEKWIEWV